MNRSTVTVQSSRLRLWLPLVVVLAFLLIIGVFALAEISDEAKSVREDARRTIQLTASQLTAPLRRALESGRQADVRLLVSSIVLHDDIDLAALTDEHLQIHHASQFGTAGKPLASLLPGHIYHQHDVLDNHVDVISTQRGLIGTIAIRYTPEGGTRSDARSALLWLQVDTARNMAAMWRDVAIRLGAAFAVGGVLTLALLGLLYRTITRPLERLAGVTREIAEDKLDIRLDIQGRGEIALLGQSMQRMVGQIRDTITALRESEQRLSITLDSIGDAVLVTDVHGLVTRLNPEAERLTGWSQEKAVGHPVIEVFHIVNAETREPAEHPVGRVLREGMVVGLANHTTLIARNGQEFQIADSAAPIRDPAGDTIGVIMVFQNVTDRYRMESELRQVRERLEAILHSLPDPCFVLDANGRYIDVMGGAQELLTASREHLLDRTVSEVLPPEDAKPIMAAIQSTLETGKPMRVEYRLDTVSGLRHFEGATALLQLEREQSAVLWLARDKTAQKEAEERLRHLAYYDQLTGLANRKLMVQRIDEALARAQRHKHRGAVLFFDIDYFKDINDSLGHPAGDQLLQHIGKLIRDATRKEDLAARFGGDEFVIVLEDIGDELIAASSHAEFIAEKLRQMCNAPVMLENSEQYITTSTGIVIFPNGESDADALLKQADMAMFKAKQSGRNQICFFASELQQAAENRLRLQRDLHRALEEDQFRLHVQPTVDGQGRWIGGEVLVRWEHPERGLILPAAFIPGAEANGLIDDIDRWVISHALARLGARQHQLPEIFEGLSFNITADLLLDPGFPEELQNWLLETALDPSLIELEITERVLLGDHQQATEVIEALRHLGIHFSIDDFGTGYSSLRYLQQLPIDTLKIDRSFVERLPDHAGDSRIVITIIDMARHLALHVTAEGVENAQQQQFLMENGCHQFQGYHFARPMPWEDFFEKLL